MKHKLKKVDEYYAIEKDGLFYRDFGENANVLTTDIPSEAYKYRNKDAADFELAEYDKRFIGYRVVEIIETTTVTWGIK